MRRWEEEQQRHDDVGHDDGRGLRLVAVEIGLRDEDEGVVLFFFVPQVIEQIRRPRTLLAHPFLLLRETRRTEAWLERCGQAIERFDIAWTREVASRIGAMGYTISKVGRADRFSYTSTTVFYGPGGQAVGLRLARQLGVADAPTPGLTKNQLLVIVGPKTVAAQG